MSKYKTNYETDDTSKWDITIIYLGCRISAVFYIQNGELNNNISFF